MATDLLVGIGAGILLKIFIHLVRGASLKHIFQSMTQTEDKTVFIKGAAVFSNFSKTKQKIRAFGFDKHVVVNLDDCSFIDHSVMEAIHLLSEEFKAEGGRLEVVGLEHFENFGKSTHGLSAKKRSK
ncbi:MAG: hypothetical protein EBV23_07515 [Flavobacteriia bacterium]|nr:hypothetical protein [Flavobacteriia bacterium]